MGDCLHMATVDEAQACVRSIATTGPSESIALAGALGRVLAEPVQCDIDYPPFTKAMMDGYALRSADAQAGTELSIVGQVAAGSWREAKLSTGQAVQINTGAPLPPGADAVIRVEDTTVADDRVTLNAAVTAGKNVTERGKYVSAGDAVLKAGTRLGPVELGVAASAGAANVVVSRKPAVAIIGTGDELVDVSVKPTGGQIRNSNSPMMRALAEQAGGRCVDLGTVSDDVASLERAICKGLESDFLCLSGGISMGEFDFVPATLEKLGVRFLVRKVAMKPGKPTIIGVHESGCRVFALPGNPLSTFVAFWLFVRPVVNGFLGLADAGLNWVSAMTVETLPATTGRESFWPGKMGLGDDGVLTVRRHAWQGSGDLFGFAGANALIRRSPNQPELNIGERVQMLMLERF